MKPKSEKENEFPKKKPAAKFSKTSSKKKEPDIDNDVDVEIKDDWEKADGDEEDFDTDFEEFNIPKSKIKKTFAKKGKGYEDFYLDKDFKDLDLFNDGTDPDDDEDDF
jgi:DNA-directed RNA polymerase subunit delta